MYKHHLFIGFQAEYNTACIREMHKLGFPQKISYIVENLNNEIHANVKISKHLVYEIIDSKGLRLGDAITPLLFSIKVKQSNYRH
jgi:hypothetical protein